MHKSSCAISWIYNVVICIIFTIYHHFLKGTMYLTYSGTLCMKIHLLKITKCLAHYIYSCIICISNNLLKARSARILKSKIKNHINSVKLWQIHKYNGKNDYNLKFIFLKKSERNSLFRFELSSSVTLSKYWL